MGSTLLSLHVTYLKIKIETQENLIYSLSLDTVMTKFIIAKDQKCFSPLQQLNLYLNRNLDIFMSSSRMVYVCLYLPVCVHTCILVLCTFMHWLLHKTMLQN